MQVDNRRVAVCINIFSFLDIKYDFQLDPMKPLCYDLHIAKSGKIRMEGQESIHNTPKGTNYGNLYAML